MATLVSVGAGTTAGAAPKDKAETFSRDGEETTFIVGCSATVTEQSPDGVAMYTISFNAIATK